MNEQLAICEKYGVIPFATPSYLKVGISLSAKEGQLPLNGIRCLPVGDTTGWYIYGGEYSSAPDFFLSLHISHLAEWCPAVTPYLLLPPGWGFVIAPDYEDVFFNQAYLDD